MNTEKEIVILIPNGTGPTNIGDQAILKGLLKIIRSYYKNSYIILQTSELKSYKEKPTDELKENLYSWAVYAKTNPFTRIFRLSLVLSNLITTSINRDFVIGPKELREIVRDFKQADLIIFTGGGYFRTKKGFTQTLNILMIALIFQFAKNFKARKIAAPMSFGPFGYAWQEKMLAAVLRNIDLVTTREEISFQVLKKYRLKNLIPSSDLALQLVKMTKSQTENQKFIIGFTIRDWLPKDKQQNLEASYVQAISNFISQNTSVKVQPIVQVDGPKYGDLDLQITKKIGGQLRKLGITVLPVKNISSVEDGLRTYNSLDLLIGMRMHSNILAANVNVPFVAISYEYKTEGITRNLGVENNCIKVNDTNTALLTKLIFRVHKNRQLIKRKLRQNIYKINLAETRKWSNILGQYNFK